MPSVFSCLFSLSGVSQVFGAKRAQLAEPEEAGPHHLHHSSPDQLSDLSGFGQTLQGPEFPELWKVHLHRSRHGNYI